MNVFQKQRQEIQQKKQQSSEDIKHGARQAAKDRNIKTHRSGLELSLEPTFFVAPRPIGHTLYVHRNTHHYSN